jgi:hypothetical protein
MIKDCPFLIIPEFNWRRNLISKEEPENSGSS